MLHGAARYLWKHGIPARKQDVWAGGELRARQTRTSLTFRALRPEGAGSTESNTQRQVACGSGSLWMCTNE